MVEMKVKTIAWDAETKLPVMFLSDVDEKHFLAIYIGIFEAQAISAEMEGTSSPRPMTHDLMKILVDQLGAKLVRVVVNDLQDTTYFARLVLDVEGKSREVDARPSDSVALALRFKAPIFITENVLMAAAMPNKDKIAEEKKKFKEFVDQMSAEMFANPAPPGPATIEERRPPADE